MECVNCKRRLEMGVDALTLQEAVVGPRGLVPLAEPLVFCSEGCAREYFGGEPVTHRRPRRVA